MNITAKNMVVYCSIFLLSLVTNYSFAANDNLIALYNAPKASFTVNATKQCISNNKFQFTNESQSNCGCLKYLWDFGDTTTSTETNPTKVYTKPGEYTVRLQVTDDINQTDTYSLIIQVTSTPSLDFTVNPTLNQCFKGNNYSFTNTSHGDFSGLQYKWDLGNGVTSTETNAATSYSQQGIYTIRLDGSYNGICSTSVTKTIDVYPSPIANYNYVIDSSNNKKISFTNESTVSNRTLNYEWHFGDESISGDTNPVYTFSKNGIYSVSLKVATNENDCIDQISKLILIGNQPTSGFTVGVGTQCLKGNKYNFTNTTVAPTGATVNYLWYFGDGTGSTQENPIKSYNISGTFTVKLIVTASNGFSDSTTKNVTVLSSPMASYTISPGTDKCLTNNNIFTFTNTSTIPTGLSYNYQWNLGNGRILNTLNASDLYNGAGSYSITLTANLSNGCSADTTQIIHVHSKPTASFTFGVDKNDYHQLSFDNHSFDNYGNSISYFWDFGDGHTSTQTNSSNLYASNGNYIIKLIATGTDFGCSDTLIKPILVKDSLWAYAYIGNACQCVDINGFNFIGDAGGSISPYTYYWNFDDGTFSNEQNPTKKYASYGDHTVVLTVSNSSGTHATASTLIRVYAVPVAGFTYLPDSINKFEYHFKNTSTIAFGNMVYKWSFGDGTFSTEQNPTKTFSASGNYSIKLVAYNTDGGCADSSITQIQIANNSSCNLVASFSINNSNQCVTNNQFVFTNLTSGGSGTINYVWDFNDGTSSNEKNPSKIYSTYSDHDVSLTVTDSKGCYSNVVKQIAVGAVPTASFNVIANTFNGNGYTFLSTSSIASGTISYYWDFGNGQTSSLSNPTVIFNSGNYTVKLVVQGIGICEDSAFKTIVVNTNPIADFSFTRSGCSAASEAFNFSSTITNGTAPYTYLWDFGDGNISTEANPIHQYVYANTYNVTLKITDAAGKTNQKTVAIQSMAGSKPKASFIILSNTQNGNSYTFISTSTIASGWMNYFWNLGDGHTSTAINPSITYPSNGNYPIKLVVTGSTGCKDSVTQIVNFTNTQSAQNGGSGIAIDATPNPAITNVVLSFRPTFIINKIVVKLFNSSGQFISQQLIIPNQSGAVITLLVNVFNLNKGYYYMILSDEKEQFIGSSPLFKN